MKRGNLKADGNQYTECPNWTSTCGTPPSIVGVNWLRFQYGSGPDTTPPNSGGKGRRRSETQARGVRLTAFPRIPRPYSKGHRNADHLDDGGRPQDALASTGTGHQATPGRDQTNVGDIPAGGLGKVTLGRGRGPNSFFTHAREAGLPDHTTGFATGRLSQYRENTRKNAIE
jgi:hypothetical protein